MPASATGFVLDCSVTMTWCFEDEIAPETDALLERLEETTAFVTAHWPLEVANTLRGAERRARLTQEIAEKFFTTLRALSIAIDRETPDHAWGEIMRLSRQHSLTPYDAAYLELALRLGLPLATLDKELRRAAQNAGVMLL